MPGSMRRSPSPDRRPTASLVALFGLWLCLGSTGSAPLRGAGEAAAEGTPADAGTLLAAADEALASGNAAAAEGLYRRLLAADPDLLPAYRGLAEAVAAQDRAAAAASVLTRLGEGLIRAEVHAAAVEALRRAAELDPGSARVHALLGRGLSIERRYLEAARQLARAVELGESDLRTLLYLGAARWENGQVAEAEATYRRAVSASGGHPVPRHQLGRLLLWQGHHAEAVEVLSAAAAASPDAADLHLDLARALHAAGDLEPATDAFRRAVALAPERSHARYGLARVLARRGQTEAAREQLEVYRRLYAAEQERVRAQELAEAELGRGWELLHQGRIARARALFAGLPESGDALAGVAATHLAAGEADAAVAALERAVTLEPERGDLRLRLAEARLRAAGGAP